MISPLIEDNLSFFALAAAFYAGLAMNADPVRTIFKGLPIALLLLRVLLARRPHSRLVSGGLLFGLLGDLFLEFERLNHVRLYFELGIAAFLLGHVIYVWAFLVAEHKFVRSGAKNIVRTLAPVWLVAVAVFGAILRFGHIEAALVAPVFVYAMTIMTMLGVALVLKDQWVTFGALLFVCSDLLLAVDRFVVPVPQSTFLIMTTYYGAQFFIATSFA